MTARKYMVKLWGSVTGIFIYMVKLWGSVTGIFIYSEAMGQYYSYMWPSRWCDVGHVNMVTSIDHI